MIERVTAWFLQYQAELTVLVAFFIIARLFDLQKEIRALRLLLTNDQGRWDILRKKEEEIRRLQGVEFVHNTMCSSTRGQAVKELQRLAAEELSRLDEENAKKVRAVVEHLSPPDAKPE